ncbi:MAG: hypothetical protein RR728_05220, partial [Oscillospiraceae bacterium]
MYDFMSEFEKRGKRRGRNGEIAQQILQAAQDNNSRQAQTATSRWGEERNLTSSHSPMTHTPLEEPERNEELEETMRRFAAGDTKWLDEAIHKNIVKSGEERDRIANEGVNSWARQESRKEAERWNFSESKEQPVTMPSPFKAGERFAPYPKPMVQEQPKAAYDGVSAKVQTPKITQAKGYGDSDIGEEVKPPKSSFESRRAVETPTINGKASTPAVRTENSRDGRAVIPYGTRPSITSKPKLDKSWWAGSSNTQYDENKNKYQGIPNEPLQGSETDKINKERAKEEEKRVAQANDEGSINRRKIKSEIGNDLSTVGEIVRYEEMNRGINQGVDFDLENNPRDREIFEKHHGKSPEELLTEKLTAQGKVKDGLKKLGKAQVDYLTQEEIIEDGALALSMDADTEMEKGVMRAARATAGDVVGSVAIVGESIGNSYADMAANLKNKEYVEKKKEIAELNQLIGGVKGGQRINQNGNQWEFGRLRGEYDGEMAKLYKGKETEKLAEYTMQLEQAQEDLKNLAQVSYNDIDGLGFKMKEAADEDMNKLLENQPTWVQVGARAGKDIVVSMALGPILGTGYNVITAAGEEAQASTAAGESSMKALAEAT